MNPFPIVMGSLVIGVGLALGLGYFWWPGFVWVFDLAIWLLPKVGIGILCAFLIWCGLTLIFEGIDGY